MSNGKFPGADLLMNFLLRLPATLEISLYFSGYCGEHISNYLQIEQQSGSEIITRKTFCSHMSSLVSITYLHHWCPTDHFTPCSTFQVSHTFPPPRTAARISDNNDIANTGSSTAIGTASNPVSILHHLKAGGGISKWQLSGLVEHCDKCNKYYLPHFFKDHICGCDGSLIIL